MKRFWNFLINKPQLAVILGLLVYLPLLNGHFIQEEWHLMLNFSLRSDDYLRGAAHYLAPTASQYIPIAQVAVYTMFYLFQINFYAYLIVGLLLQGVLGYLLFIWFKQISKEKTLSLLAAFIYVIAPHHFQATSWVVANFGYALSGIFMVGAFILFWKWLEKGSLKYALFSSLLILAALLSKDIAVFSLIFLPLMTYLLKRDVSKFIKSIAIVIPGTILKLWFFWDLKMNPIPELTVNNPPGLVNLVTLPARALAESVVPQHTIYTLAKGILLLLPPYSLDKLYSTSFNQRVESSGAAIVVILILLLFLYIGLKLSKTKHRYTYLVGLLLTMLSSLPFFFVDTKNFSLLQPRYIYVPLIGSCLAVIPLMSLAISKWKGKATITIMLIAILFMATTWNMSTNLASVGQERKYILNAIRDVIPANSKNTLIYVDSDTSFYGMPDESKILPFQYPPHKVVATYLYDEIYLPQKIYDYEFMKGLDSQGLLEDGGGSYGYFIEYNFLARTIKEYPQYINDVYAFKYEGKLKHIKDITAIVREKLRKEI